MGHKTMFFMGTMDGTKGSDLPAIVCLEKIAENLERASSFGEVARNVVQPVLQGFKLALFVLQG